MAVANTMDFFKSQDIARRKTSILVLYYCLAVVMIILAVYAAAMMLFQGAMVKSGSEMALKTLWNPELFIWITGVTSAIVLIGSIFKISQLSSGGAVVAEMLGGLEIETNTRDLNQRKILNIVEEMAIASGLPVPRVFLLDDEDGINAFAAGFSPSDAVIGVTRGCINQLNRDELQGVIAHEFSHILNGDMKLNIRLMGVLNGILVIGLIGFWIFRSTSRSRSKKGNALPIILFGVVVWAIGYIGVFFGKLIKSAVSRQREYLADASAVQFTRNPGGIAGALKKIGGFAGGSRLATEHAEEASHFFFSNGLAGSFINLMATHPPIEDRISRLDPFFEMERAGQLGVSEIAPPQLSEERVAGVSSFAVNPDRVIASVGVPTSSHVKYAAGLISKMPSEVVEAVHEPHSAGAVIYALLLDKKVELRQQQLKYLSGNVDADVSDHILRLIPVVDEIGNVSKLPLVDMAIPALKKMTNSQYSDFRTHVDALVAADKEIDLFEYTLQRIIMCHLESAYGRIKPQVIRYQDIKSVLPVCGKLLSCLAYWGADDEETAKRAFDSGAGRLGDNRGTLVLSHLDQCGMPMLDEALSQAADSAPMVKKRVLDACVACIAADGTVTHEESELIRAIADSMGCPIPPFLPGKLN